MSEQTKSLAILFADLGGSTQLYESLGDEEAQRIVAGCLGIASEVVAQYGGRVVKTIGDEVMATFPSAEGAACAGLGIIASLRAAVDLHEGRLGAHVGFHVGPVIEEEGDVFGDTVNLAARMVSLAVDGEILTTNHGAEALPPSLRDRTRRLDRRPVKGKREAVEVFQLIEESAEVTSMTPVPIQHRRGPGRLELHYQGQVLEVDDRHPSITIGRSAENDLVLPSNWVSRRHARIKLRHGKFVLFDESSNGTLMRGVDGKAVLLRREDLILPAQGSLGVNIESDHDEGELPIRFEIVES